MIQENSQIFGDRGSGLHPYWLRCEWWHARCSLLRYTVAVSSHVLRSASDDLRVSQVKKSHFIWLSSASVGAVLQMSKADRWLLIVFSTHGVRGSVMSPQIRDRRERRTTRAHKKTS